MARGTTVRRLMVACAAGGLLLTACGTGDATSASSGTPAAPGTTSSTAAAPASSTTAQPPATSTSDSAPPAPDGAGELAPVNCGEVTLDTGAVHELIATPTEAGLVGCTEAFNVIDEFVKLPADKRGEASLGHVVLASGWSCTVDDGATANISCSKDGLGLQTEEQAG